MSNIDLTIFGKDFEKTRKDAVTRYREYDPECRDGTMEFKELNFELDSLDFKNGGLTAYGEVQDLGWINIELELDLDTVTDMIEYYIKQVNKVKTVLEAVK